MTENIDDLYPDLTKWPRLIVQGKTVSPDQAAEVIIRTNGRYLATNDREWEKLLYQALGVPQHQFDPQQTTKESEASWKAESAAWTSLGTLRLDYLTNARLASAYIFGPHGWMDWDGTIRANSYNVGKWPTATDILEELEEIAQVFPFLDMSVQLIPNEGLGNGITFNEYGGIEIGDEAPCIEFEVKDGKVRHFPPEGRLEKPSEPDFTHAFLNRSERSTVALDFIKKHADRIREKIAAQPKPKKRPLPSGRGR